MSELSPQSHFGFSQDFLSSNATQNTSFETRESSIGEVVLSYYYIMNVKDDCNGRNTN